MCLQLSFKQLEQGKGIGRSTGKSGNDPVVIEAAYRAGIALYNSVSHGYLDITTNGHVFAASD